jgi:phosphoglycolate phosphatase-like HAD superfamily hydrolase
MTLIDSRRAILASFAAVAAETGVTIDPAGVDSRLGVTLEAELGHWFPAGEIAAAIAIYRRHYPVLAGPLTSALPGAHEALSSVRSAGARVVVITAKYEPTARRSLDDLGLAVDAVYGEAHGPQKGTLLSELGASVYVGDTPADMGAAVQSGAYPVGVPTGSFTSDDLQSAGAKVVLASLAEFPGWYRQHRAWTGGPA